MSDPVKTDNPKVRVWMLFTVLAGLLPFLLSILFALDNIAVYDWALLFGRGDLYIVAAVLTAGGLGELTATGKKLASKTGHNVTWLVWFIGIVSVALYAHVQGTIVQAKAFHPIRTSEISILAFFAATIATYKCLTMGKEQEGE